MILPIVKRPPFVGPAAARKGNEEAEEDHEEEELVVADARWLVLLLEDLVVVQVGPAVVRGICNESRPEDLSRATSSDVLSEGFTHLYKC